MYYRHKGYGFNVTSAQLPASQRWAFVAEIDKDEQPVKKIASKETFATAKEAQTEGLSAARKWIDER